MAAVLASVAMEQVRYVDVVDSATLVTYLVRSRIPDDFFDELRKFARKDVEKLLICMIPERLFVVLPALAVSNNSADATLVL